MFFLFCLLGIGLTAGFLDDRRLDEVQGKTEVTCDGLLSLLEMSILKRWQILLQSGTKTNGTFGTLTGMKSDTFLEGIRILKKIGDKSLPKDRIAYLVDAINNPDDDPLAMFEGPLFWDTDTFSADDISEYMSPDAEFDKQLVGLLAIENIFTAVKSSLRRETRLGWWFTYAHILELLALKEKELEYEQCGGEQCIINVIKTSNEVVNSVYQLEVYRFDEPLRPFTVAAYILSEMLDKGLMTDESEAVSGLIRFVPLERFDCRMPWMAADDSFLPVRSSVEVRKIFEDILKQTQGLLCPNDCQ